MKIDLNPNLRGFDFLKADNGALFCIVGDIHPPDRNFGFFKYVPAAPGTISPWKGKNGITYTRQVSEYHVRVITSMFESLENDFLFYSPISHLQMTALPHNRVIEQYNCQTRAKEILEIEQGLDDLEKETKILLQLFKDSGVLKLGITGSILLNIHNSKISDIDLIVIGRENGKKAREIVKSRNSSICKLSKSKIESSVLKQSRLFDVEPSAISPLIKRRWNQALFQNRRFSIHVLRDQPEEYGAVEYCPRFYLTVICTITDTGEGIFYPPQWTIEVEQILDSPYTLGEKQNQIEELISFEGIFTDVLKEGERVCIRAKLEDVYLGKKYHHSRLVVGGPEERSWIQIIKE